MRFNLEVPGYPNIVYVELYFVQKHKHKQKDYFNCLLLFKLFLVVSKLYELSE